MYQTCRRCAGVELANNRHGLDRGNEGTLLRLREARAWNIQQRPIMTGANTTCKASNIPTSLLRCQQNVSLFFSNLSAFNGRDFVEETRFTVDEFSGVIHPYFGSLNEMRVFRPTGES
jgi:hypothetical protein